MKKSKIIILAFIIITLIQVAIIVSWGFRKENLYWDEFFTLEGAHYFSSSNSGEHYIDEDPDFKVGKWVPVSFVKDTLVVGEEESLLNEPFTEVLKKITGYHNYSAYLNIAESLISSGRFSIWPAILLNIFFFSLNQLLVFVMCNNISKDETFPLAVCLMYGFSSMCISMSVFIRCYMLATTLVSLFTCVHLFYYENNGETIIIRLKRIILLVLMAISMYMVHNIAQYSIVYGGIFIIAFAILLYVKKGIKRFLYYSIPMLGGGFFYLYTQTTYLQILFNFTDSYSKAYVALWATLDGIVQFKISYLPERMLDMMHIFGRYLFGSFFAMLMFIAIVIVMAVLHKMGKRNDDNNGTFLPFIVVPVFAALVYIAIFTAFGLYAQVRYISFVFPELAILVMFLSYNTFRTKKYKYAFAIAMILTVILSVNFKGKVDMLYTGDRESIERIREFDSDSFLVWTGTHPTFITYETAFVAEDDDEFFAFDDRQDDAWDNLKSNLRDRMILVGYYGVSTQEIQDFLRENGYQVEWIADTYNSVFYTAIRG